MTVYAAHRSRELQTSRKLIEMLDDLNDPPARPPPTKLRPFVIRAPTPVQNKAPVSSISSQVQPQTVSISSSILRPTSAPASSAVKTALIKQEGGITSAQLTSLVSPTITSQAVRAALTSSKFIELPHICFMSKTSQIAGYHARLLVPTSW